MTRDVFDIPFGTLDVIIAVVLIRLGLPATLNIWANGGSTPDQIAADNAARFIEHFGDRRIAAIKAVREATGLELRSAKYAVVQVYETYQTAEHYASLAIEALQDGRYSEAYELTAKAIEQSEAERGW